MIRFEHLTMTYPNAAEPVLRDVNFEIPAGELCLVVGTTGSGKSTLLGTINGLVPHFTGASCAAVSSSRVVTRARIRRASLPPSSVS